MYLLMIITVTISCVYLNLKASKGNQWVRDGTEDQTEISFVARTSIGNHGENSDNYDDWTIILQQSLNVLNIFIILCWNVFHRREQRRVHLKISKEVNNPSDFALFMTNIPRNKTMGDLVFWLSERYHNIEVISVNGIYDLKHIMPNTKKLKILLQKKGYLLSYKSKCMIDARRLNEVEGNNDEYYHPPPKKSWCFFKKEYELIEVIDTKILETKFLIEALMPKLEEEKQSELFSGKCFIVFNNKSDAK